MSSLEFCLPPEELPRLFRQPAFRRQGGRPAVAEMIWHDTATAELAADHLSLCEGKAVWRLERASPRPAELWPPGTPAPCLAEAADPAEFGPLPGPLLPIAGFRGQRRQMKLGDGGAAMTVTDGSLRGMSREKPVCRLMLEGTPPALMALSQALAESVPVEVPRWTMATEAAAFARGWAAPPRRSGGPEVPPGLCVTEAAALVFGHLTDVILAGVPDAGAGETPEPVHAMRVAVRRLRSALSVFRKAADCPEITAVKTMLHELAATLGAARDWDVFLAGIGQEVAAALPDDLRIQTMLEAATRRREAAYANLRREFGSPSFRRLAVALVQLSALRPWEIGADEERAAKLALDSSDYAATLLAKRHEHMLDPGPDISGLPVGDLHALRKQGKRLRYAAEFFAPMYGRRSTRRFVRGVSRLQEALGHLNDGNAAAGLMNALKGGPDRQFAAGAVQGFAAARSVDARSEIAKSWAKFRRAEPFWD